MQERRFETNDDRTREALTLLRLADHAGLTVELMQELSPVDAKLYRNGKVVAYAEVKTYKQTFEKAKTYIFVAVKKLAKLQEVSVANRVPVYMVYRFNDCIGYYAISQIDGARCGWDGRNPREGSMYDKELVVYIPKSMMKLI